MTARNSHIQASKCEPHIVRLAGLNTCSTFTFFTSTKIPNSLRDIWSCPTFPPIWHLATFSLLWAVLIVSLWCSPFVWLCIECYANAKEWGRFLGPIWPAQALLFLRSLTFISSVPNVDNFWIYFFHFLWYTSSPLLTCISLLSTLSDSMSLLCLKQWFGQ